MKKINTICIIDDDPITVFGIKKMLEKIIDCKNLITYSNGKIAIDGINDLQKKENIPDLIFLDINMPIMDGWQFLEEFIKLPIQKKVRINIVTSSIDPADHEKWLYYKLITEHPIEFINKPIHSKDILKVTLAA